MLARMENGIKALLEGKKKRKKQKYERQRNLKKKEDYNMEKCRKKKYTAMLARIEVKVLKYCEKRKMKRNNKRESYNEE